MPRCATMDSPAPIPRPTAAPAPVRRREPDARRGVGGGPRVRRRDACRRARRAGRRRQFLVLDGIIGAVYLGGGVIAWRRRPEVLTGPLLVACAALNFLGSYGPSGRPVVTHLGFAFEGYYDVALAVLVLALPARLPAGLGRWLSLAMLGAFLVRSASRLLLQDPAQLAPDAGLPPNPFAIAASPDAFLAVETITSAVIAVLALAVALVCLARLIGSRPIVRRVMWPILVAGIVAMGAAAFDAAETRVLHRDRRAPARAARRRGRSRSRGCCSSPACWSRSASSSARCGCAGQADRSSRSPSGWARSPPRSGSKSALAAALGDPGLRLVRPDPAGDGWTAADGRPVPAPVDDDTPRGDAAGARRRAARRDRPRPGAARGSRRSSAR